MRILHISDLEMDKDLMFFEEAKRVALEEKVDAIFYTGDFIDGRSDIIPMIAEAEKEKEQEISRRVSGNLTAEEQKTVGVVQRVGQFGGIEALKKALPTIYDSDTRDRIKEDIREYESNASAIKAIKGKLSGIKELVEGAVAEQDKRLVKKLTDVASKKYKAIDELFASTMISGRQVPVFYVLGNHDPKIKGCLPHLHNVEDEPKVFRGLKIQGASGVHSYDNIGYPDVMIAHFDRDPSVQKYRDFVNGGMDKKIAKGKLLQASPTYQRLKGEEMDVLLLHKGPGRLGQELSKESPGTLTDFGGWGFGIENIVKEKKPSVFCGHLSPGRHGIEDFDGAKFFGSRANTYWMHVCAVSDNDKNVVSVRPYRYAV